MLFRSGRSLSVDDGAMVTTAVSTVVEPSSWSSSSLPDGTDDVGGRCIDVMSLVVDEVSSAEETRELDGAGRREVGTSSSSTVVAGKSSSVVSVAKHSKRPNIEDETCVYRYAQ